MKRTRVALSWMGLILSAASCGHEPPTAARGTVAVQVEARFPESNASQRQSIPTAPTARGLDSVQVLAFDVRPPGDVLLASHEIALDTAAVSFVAAMQVPHANLYRIVVRAVGQRNRGQIDSTGYGLQYYGERVLDAGLGILGAVVIQMVDAVPFGEMSFDSSFVVDWTPIPFARDYTLVALRLPVIRTPGPPVDVGQSFGIYRIQANFVNGFSSAFSEPALIPQNLDPARGPP